MDRGRYEQIAHSFAGQHVVVLGDLMLDEYVWGRATRISPESPVMVVEVDREDWVPGGAANVINNLLALKAHVSAIGTVGADEGGAALIASLSARGADVTGIVTDPSRPTTRKTRIVAHSQQVLRVDREQTHAVSPEIAEQLLEHVRSSFGSARSVVVSDYRKGVVTPEVASGCVSSARSAGVLLTSNPKPSSARMLRGADVLSLNQSEAEATSGDTRFRGEEGLEAAGRGLLEELGVETLMVTRGAKGLSLFYRSGGSDHVAAHAVEVYDVAGAGDTVISTLTLALGGGASALESATVANHAAACVVRKVGVATVTTEELLNDWRE